MSHTAIADDLRELEAALVASQLGLRLLDRVGPIAQCAPTNLLHRGVIVRPSQTVNTGQYRDDEHARVSDSYVVELAYMLTPTAQRTSREEALVLEEQVRVLLTGLAVGLTGRLRYVGTTSRGLHPEDASWWMTSMTYTRERDALLGG